MIPIAGNILDTGSSIDPKVTSLKAQDANMYGLLIELYGGKYGKQKQRAVIEMICDPDRTGNNDKGERRKRNEDGEEPKADLTFTSYEEEEGKKGEKFMTLRLGWRSKYACEGYEGDDGAKKSGWGFFTWFILM